MNPSIDILLSTYNGARFLREQLDSILAQQAVDARIIVRDDGSVDGTPEVLAAYEARYPGRVVVVRDGRGNLGVVRSYELLLGLATADYMAFADQDDVWLPYKLERSITTLVQIEDGGSRPALVFTDLRVVDEGLATIHPSFHAYLKIRAGRARSVPLLAVQNSVVGCTAVFNRALACVATPFPAAALMHDWWLALCAAACGATAYLAEPTVLYRQHSGNVVGARGFLARARSAWARRNDTYRALEQALALRGLACAVTPRAGAFLRRLAVASGSFRRKLVLIRHGAFKDGLVRNIYFFILAR